MTSLPDWLVERAALDEVPPASRERIGRADPRELAERIAALRSDNTAELAGYPAAPAVAQIEARVAGASRLRAARRRRRIGLLGIASTAVVVAVLVLLRPATVDHAALPGPEDDVIRAKGPARLLAFRHLGERIERVSEDALVRPGDLIQLRYHPGGRGYGVIASIDGAGAVTLHHPASEDAPPEATALSAKTTALPHAYALDDAPRFERFFFITADEPIDVQYSLATLRAFAQRADNATASLELPDGLRQSSLRLRKPDRH